MKNKFLNAEFGYCPRILCERQIVLPIAMSEDLSISRVKVFCPKCEDVYVPRNRFVDIDGAYFGCSFPSIFFQTFPDLIPKEKPNKYIPRYEDALEMILSSDIPDSDDLTNQK